MAFYRHTKTVYLCEECGTLEQDRILSSPIPSSTDNAVETIEFIRTNLFEKVACSNCKEPLGAAYEPND